MREILFRGKTPSGEWVVGYYSPANMPIVGCMGHFINVGGYNAVEIDPETVGQYTGLTDKNGKKIFEGDIVQANFRNNHSKQKFCVIFNDGMFLFDNNYVSVPKYDIYAMEVIGNIHDNPELLKEGADNG